MPKIGHIFIESTYNVTRYTYMIQKTAGQLCLKLPSGTGPCPHEGWRQTRVFIISSNKAVAQILCLV